MSIDIKEVEHIAALARLDFGPEEKKTLQAQLSDILEYIGKLNELDTSAVEPTSHVIGLTNVARDDLTAECLSPDSALRNAPDRSGGFYRVPRIIE